ncbi:ATP-binding cassette domain-containing protein [Bifidobacterium sp. ESL0784]|uniref:ATP-binding cassette domain-containing protein n=1 Tax=Bifidobacterium sp. ESL0784 TaxID=2983231 RepID=UPI0023F646EB|nr:ATP-binding cassette domain-containing protein [Bifidobacterium sp. ESL0784]MDF7640200.1 ATP-binding cassette domain-containing protein [Bifidobacterium sp. ESL0784]
MSKNTDSNDEALSDMPDKKPENTEDTSAVKYDVVFDDDDDALDFSSLAVSGQVPANGSDDTEAGNPDGTVDTDGANGKGNAKESGSATTQAHESKTGHAGKQSSTTATSDALKAPDKNSNDEGSADADEESGDSGDKASPDIAARANAQRVNETLGLAVAEEDELSAHEAESPVIEPATAVSARLDKETIAEADILLKPNPTFALDHVTFVNNKTGRNVLDNIDWGFFAGSLYAITGADDEQRRALLAVATGFYRPDSGQVMVKSQSLLELETNEIRGHRIGLITQRYSLRDDLDALSNLTFTMRASGRTFLKPVVEAARDVLKYVDFDEAATGVKVPDLKPVNQRRLAIARAICCEATVILADDPLGGLDDDDRSTVLNLLSRIAHAQDPKRCVIVLVPGFGAETAGNTQMNASENDSADADTDTSAEASNHAGTGDGNDTGNAKDKADAAVDSDEYTGETDYEAKADKVYSF